jgi:hypothetical protein
MSGKALTVILCNVKVLATGMDGGHTYLCGRTDHPPHGTVDAWAYFDFEDRPQEADFEARYARGDVEVSSDSWEYLPSTGLSLHNITWRNVDPVTTPEV